GRVARAYRAAAGQAHAVLLEHVAHRLAGVARLGAVAAAVEADDDAVADQLVLAHALHVHQAAEPLRRCRSGQQQRGQQREPALGDTHRCAAEACGHVHSGASGWLKKRDSQPLRLALATVPRPEYWMRALATRCEDTRFPVSTSPWRT